MQCQFGLLPIAKCHVAPLPPWLSALATGICLWSLAHTAVVVLRGGARPHPLHAHRTVADQGNQVRPITRVRVIDGKMLQTKGRMDAKHQAWIRLRGDPTEGIREPEELVLPPREGRLVFF